MRLNSKYVIFGCVLLLVLLLSMSVSCGATPYESTTRSYAFFEGITTMELEMMRHNFDTSTNELLEKLDAVLSDAEKHKYNVSSIRTQGSYDAKQVKMYVDKVMSEADKTTESYKLIQTYAETKLQPMLDAGDMKVDVKEGFADIFSTAKGNQTCSSGLTNSMGALCLSEEQLYMLRSRGGNSTGRDSQIGS